MSERVAAGEWARVHRVELAGPQRAEGVPRETAAVPFETWVNGWLVAEAALGEDATVRTATGRLVPGRLVERDPGYRHTFGAPPPLLREAAERARARVFGGGSR